jgi:hypothetical protein
VLVYVRMFFLITSVIVAVMLKYKEDFEMRYQKPRFTYIQVMCDSLYNSCHKVFLNWIKEVLNDAIKIVSFVRYRCYRTDYFPYAVMKFSDPIITFFCIQKLNACQEMTFFSVSLRSKIKCNFMLRIINKLYLNNRMWNMTFNFVTAVIFLKKLTTLIYCWKETMATC